MIIKVCDPCLCAVVWGQVYYGIWKNPEDKWAARKTEAEKELVSGLEMPRAPACNLVISNW